MRNVRRRQVEQNRKQRKIVFLTLGILLSIYLSFNLIVGENGFLRYVELKSTRDRLFAETMALQKQNEDITGQIENLKKAPEVIEEFAREYGLTKEGELVFKFKDKNDF
jgi:cell division protein FtsB